MATEKPIIYKPGKGTEIIYKVIRVLFTSYIGKPAESLGDN